MEYNTNKQLRTIIDSIINNYLDLIQRSKRYNIFKLQHTTNLYETDIKTTFQAINPPDINKAIVKSEETLDGYTRQYLINPILDTLFKFHNIDIEWAYESPTSGSHTATTREYEVDTFLEFVIRYNGKRIGYRYTSGGFSGGELKMMHHINCFLKQQPFPGFNRLSPVDIVYVIQWTPNEEKSNDKTIDYQTIKEINIKTFFDS